MVAPLVPAIKASPDDDVPGGLRLVPEPISHIAPDPLETAFDPDAFAARLARRKTGIKRALLDQSLISGIGNIYADEALWRARLHWARATETLRKSEVSRLLEAVDDVLSEALKAGGTSFDAQYVNVNGESGYFDVSLNAYGREGEPCARCGGADPPGRIHEPLGLQLPPLPAPPAQWSLVEVGLRNLQPPTYRGFVRFDVCSKGRSLVR